MTPAQITLVQNSFPAVLAIREAAADLFYTRLFAIDPSIRPLFHDTDMRKQGAKLMGAIAMVVRSLDTPQAILGDLKKLAERHRDYGVEDRHYFTVGEALLWTLEQGLGAAFTPELKAAWGAAYALLCSVMIPASDTHAPPMRRAG